MEGAVEVPAETAGETAGETVAVAEVGTAEVESTRGQPKRTTEMMP